MSSLKAYSLRSFCEFSAQRLSHHALQMTVPFSFGILNFGGKSEANLKFPMISWPYSALMLIGFVLVLMVLYCLSYYSKRSLLVDKLQASFYFIYKSGCVTLALFSLGKPTVCCVVTASFHIHHLITFLRCLYPMHLAGFPSDLIAKAAGHIWLRGASHSRKFSPPLSFQEPLPFSFCWLMLLSLTFGLTSGFVGMPYD